MNKELMNAVATDVFIQAQEGFAVPLDPDLADALGAFPEDIALRQVYLCGPGLMSSQYQEDI